MQPAKKVLVVDDDRALNQVLAELLRRAGFTVAAALDGLTAASCLERERFDIVLLDINLPKMSGLEVLQRIRAQEIPAKVLIMSADDTPTTVLETVKGQAYRYISKPLKPKSVVELVEQMSREDVPAPIEVISAKPDWIELLVPCRLEMAERLNSFLQPLNMHLSEEVRDSVEVAFRELLLNAIEWGGRFDPDRKVRIACIRSQRVLIYRIQDPGLGFQPENLPHAAINNAPDEPYAHTKVRDEQQIRPGGFGLLMTRVMVDELIYNESHNEVVFVKYLA
jgi:DNA-binding response OmpR family regulator